MQTYCCDPATMHMYYCVLYHVDVLLCPLHIIVSVTMHMYYCDRYYAHVLL